MSSSEDGHRLNDSDFDSSDLDPVLMSMGMMQDCESAKTAKIWSQRQAAKRNLGKRKAADAVSVDATADASVADDRISIVGSEDGSIRKRRKRGSACSVVSSKSAHSTRRSEKGPAVISEEVRNILVQGQGQYSAGLFDDAIKTMHTVVQMQPGLADPYHVLALIYEEQGQTKKKLDAMLLAAYFTPGSEGRLIWRRVAELSKQLGLLDQARYAYRRSISRNRKAEDLHSLWELSQIYLQQGRIDEGIRDLFSLYEVTKEDRIASQVARHLIARRRWRECLELLESCVERGRNATPQRIDLNILNMFCEILLEVRDYTKCANLLTDLLGVRGTCEPRRGNPACATSLSDDELNLNLRERPADLVAKLAVALCHLREPDSSGADPLCACAIEAVLQQPPATHSDLYLSLVDALLVDEIATATKVAPRNRCRSKACSWPAEQAWRIIELLEGADVSDDLRERRAMASWQLGRLQEAGELFDELLELPAERSEAESRELAARAAQVWFECGRPERADTCLGLLSYEDLRHSGMLPQALSTDQRRSYYKELSSFIDRVNMDQAKLPSGSSSPAVVDQKDLRDFAERFRHVVYDCELDFERLSSHTRSSLAESKSEAAAAASTDAVDADPEEPPPQTCHEEVATTSTALAVLPQQANSEEGDPQESTMVIKSPLAKKRSSDLQVLGNTAVILKFKRRHIGLESVEDLFGMEAYLEFVVRGIDILVAHTPRDASGAGRRARIVELSRLAELCEMILQNRRLVSLRNPVKRRSLRTLALKSVGLAFEARLWRVVFRHLRQMCSVGQHDETLALFVRVLFTHADVQLLPRKRTKDTEDCAPWEKRTAFSPWGHRNTYAASFTDARSWALRQLILKPRSFTLTLLAGYFCVVAGQYSLAIAEFSRAHRLEPFDALTCLCLSTSYLSLSMSRTAAHRHDLILKGFAFMQRYKHLRLQLTGRSSPATERRLQDFEGNRQTGEHRQNRLNKKTSEGTVERMRKKQESTLNLIARQAEASYNMGRGFHQLSICNLAVKAYRDALAIFDALEHGDVDRLKLACHEEISSPLPDPGIWRRRADLCAIRRSCAYNLALLFRAQGSIEMARKTLNEHVLF